MASLFSCRGCRGIGEKLLCVDISTEMNQKVAASRCHCSIDVINVKPGELKQISIIYLTPFSSLSCCQRNDLDYTFTPRMKLGYCSRNKEPMFCIVRINLLPAPSNSTFLDLCLDKVAHLLSF